MPRHQALLGLIGVETPEVVGGVDGATLLGHLEVDGRLGGALDDDDLVPVRANCGATLPPEVHSP